MSVMSSPPERYALVGHPVEHSRSPMIHQLFALQTGENISYELIDATPEQFETAVLGFSAAGGRGMNVTVPHKVAAFEICRAHGPEALAAKAVNTISFRGGMVRGDNTDGIGFIRDVTMNCNQAIAAQRVLILGAGGAARGLLSPVLAEKPATLVLANRTIERAEGLADEFADSGSIDVCRFEDLDDAGEFDIVINATSAGLRGEQPPFPGSLLRPDTFCYDLAYSLKETPFVTWASANGSERAVQGWGMLVEQAAESFRIWRNKRPETAPILEKLASITA